MAFAEWLGDKRFVCADLLPFATSICHQAFCKLKKKIVFIFFILFIPF